MDMADLDHVDEQTACRKRQGAPGSSGRDEDGLIIDRDGEPFAALIPAALYDELAATAKIDSGSSANSPIQPRPASD